jgi:ATP-dependent protease ClpP protease subunit
MKDAKAEMYEMGGSHQWYLSSSTLATKYTIYLHDDFRNTDESVSIIETIKRTSGNDLIEFDICSPGGMVQTYQALLLALHQTDATVVATVHSASSAAAFLALNCDKLQVTPMSRLLLHGASGGCEGHTANIINNARSMEYITDKLLDDTLGFVNRKELERMKNGSDLSFFGEEIVLRFNRMQRYQRYCYFLEQKKLTNEIAGVILDNIEEEEVEEEVEEEEVKTTQRKRKPRKRRRPSSRRAR